MNCRTVLNALKLDLNLRSFQYCFEKSSNFNNLCHISIFCEYGFRMTYFHFICMGGPSNESVGICENFMFGKCFTETILNILKLALKLQSFQLCFETTLNFNNLSKVSIFCEFPIYGSIMANLHFFLYGRFSK